MTKLSALDNVRMKNPLTGAPPEITLYINYKNERKNERSRF